jgi:hypothetical protein
LIASALASFDLRAFEKHATNRVGARQAVSALANTLQWPPLAEADDLADYLFQRLSGFPPLSF